MANTETKPLVPPPADPPEPLEKLLLRAICDPGHFPVEDNPRGERTLQEWQRDAVITLLNGGGWVLPGVPPVSAVLADAQQFAERTILAELAVRLFRVLVLGNVILPDTPNAMNWLRDWIDGTLEGHGPIGKPMIWPDRLPAVAQLLRQWGFQPTPTVPPYVTRIPKPQGQLNGQVRP